jgi:hypothetical protein
MVPDQLRRKYATQEFVAVYTRPLERVLLLHDVVVGQDPRGFVVGRVQGECLLHKQTTVLGRQA